MEAMIAHLTKIYADAPEIFTHSRGTRPGYEYEDRELDALVGPLTLSEAYVACEAMPSGYNDFTRDGLRAALDGLSLRATAFYFGREGSPCIYFDGDMTEGEVGALFPEADETMRDTNPLTGEEMCRVWWD